MIQYLILQTNVTRTVWEIVRRITSEILGVKGFIPTGDQDRISPYVISMI